MLPQGDNLSTLTILHLCTSAPSLTTIPSNLRQPFVTPPRHTQRWRGPANLEQLTITRNKSLQDYSWITDLTNLRSLRILQPLVRVRIPCVLTNMTTLTMLDTTDDDRAPTNLAAFARLKNLKLARLSHLDDREEVVRNLLTNNANLDHLEIGQCYYMSHHVFCKIDVSSLITMRLCGLVTLFQFPSLQNAWALTELSIKKCINLECCDGIANLSSITALRLSELDGLRRLPILSKLTNLVLLDVNNSWHITNLPQVIADRKSVV